jgi:hypothetical protein
MLNNRNACGEKRQRKANIAMDPQHFTEHYCSKFENDEAELLDYNADDEMNSSTSVATTARKIHTHESSANMPIVEDFDIVGEVMDSINRMESLSDIKNNYQGIEKKTEIGKSTSAFADLKGDLDQIFAVHKVSGNINNSL